MTGRFAVSGAPGGYDAWLAAECAKRRNDVVLFVTSDDPQAQAACDAIAFFAPDIACLSFPAWDCLPYDRVSPKPDIESVRLATLARLVARTDASGPAVVVTTINALTQRVPPRTAIAGASFIARAGKDVDHDALIGFLVRNGYARASTVREPGDLRAARRDHRSVAARHRPAAAPRLFRNRTRRHARFDAETQLSSDSVEQIELLPASEAPLDPDSISRFRAGYTATFGPASDDPLYESVSAGRKAPGMEHWLPLFHDSLDTLFDYLPRTLVLLGHQSEEAHTARTGLVTDYYETRASSCARSRCEERDQGAALQAAAAGHSLPDRCRLESRAGAQPRARSLAVPGAGIRTSVDAGGRQAATSRRNAPGQRPMCSRPPTPTSRRCRRRASASSSPPGASARPNGLGGVLADHGLDAIRDIANGPDSEKLHKTAVGVGVLGLEHGFEGTDFAVVAEQDILGDRMVQARGRQRRAQNFLAEASSLAAGDLVTHIEHGVGRYLGLRHAGRERRAA